MLAFRKPSPRVKNEGSKNRRQMSSKHQIKTVKMSAKKKKKKKNRLKIEVETIDETKETNEDKEKIKNVCLSSHLSAQASYILIYVFICVFRSNRLLLWRKIKR